MNRSAVVEHCHQCSQLTPLDRIFLPSTVIGSSPCPPTSLRHLSLTYILVFSNVMAYPAPKLVFKIAPMEFVPIFMLA